MDYGRKSDIGTVRLENQDSLSIFTNDEFVLLLLCDGMGGHYGGSIASSTTVNIFNNEFKKSFPNSNSNDLMPFYKWIKHTIDASRAAMIKLSDRDEAKLDMGTTVTGALINSKEKYIIIFNIGDSRTFVLTTTGELRQITVDHNLLNQLIKEGVPEMEAKKYRNWGALTSALGPDKRTKIEIFTIEKNDFNNIYSLISTSDGVHDFIEKPVLEMFLRQNKKAQVITDEIVDYALKNYSTDNASCGIVILDNKALWRK